MLITGSAQSISWVFKGVPGLWLHIFAAPLAQHAGFISGYAGFCFIVRGCLVASNRKPDKKHQETNAQRNGDMP